MLRRYPWLDYILGATLLCWGVTSLFFPDLVATESSFRALSPVLGLVGAIAAFVGLGTIAVAHRRFSTERVVISLLGLWLFLGLFFSVSSITGHFSWGALTMEEALICLAVL